MNRALALAEVQLERTPIQERPNDLDQLLLRKWAINHAQCMFAIDFLRSQRDKAEEKMLNQRPEILKRYLERNPKLQG
jgi:hypothetical protein